MTVVITYQCTILAILLLAAVILAVALAVALVKERAVLINTRGYIAEERRNARILHQQLATAKAERDFLQNQIERSAEHTR